MRKYSPSVISMCSEQYYIAPVLSCLFFAQAFDSKDRQRSE